MVRQWQSLFYNGRYSYTDISVQPDFVKLAEAYGAVGRRIDKIDEIDGALQEALIVKDRPVVLDFRVEREANVFPMVPPGGSTLIMLGED
jgi:acetolactate synthase-1/2/3 large subunit